LSQIGYAIEIGKFSPIATLRSRKMPILLPLHERIAKAGCNNVMSGALQSCHNVV
jgi:hypothetical protein